MCVCVHRTRGISSGVYSSTYQSLTQCLILICLSFSNAGTLPLKQLATQEDSTRRMSLSLLGPTTLALDHKLRQAQQQQQSDHQQEQQCSSILSSVENYPAAAADKRRRPPQRRSSSKQQPIPKQPHNSSSSSAAQHTAVSRKQPKHRLHHSALVNGNADSKCPALPPACLLGPADSGNGLLVGEQVALHARVDQGVCSADENEEGR